MRRGHPSRGGWRGESPRHFRPRMGGPPGYRPPRGYLPAQLEPPRFPPPHRYHYRGPPPFTAPPGPVQQDEHPRSGYNDHKWFRGQRDQDNNSTRSKHHDIPHEPYEKGHVYFDTTNRNDRFYVNNMGDVDQRQPFTRQTRHESYAQRDISPWPGRSHNMYERREDSPLEGSTNTIPQNDYSGHRPPASDHYEAKSASAANNPDTFSRSVDDTVNIIRRKLQTRNDPQIQSTQNIENHDNNESLREAPVDTFQTHSLQQEQSRRKHQRQRPNVKTKCDKMKNNIVHQLFKMDKDRIQRLMDNPNSSHKFEYAINSLITESQNSFNRHMRSAAEKSLCGTRNEIMEYNESDTIYEDTFMKQMQCILEPQDTVLLEDIKPLVMAELNKVLQLSEFEQRHSISDDVDYGMRDYHNSDNYLEQPYESYSGEYTADCQDNTQYYEAQSYKPPDSNDYDKRHNIRDHDSKSVLYESEHSQEYDSSILFERRPSRKSSDEHKRTRSRSSEKRRRSRSTSENALFGSPVPVKNDKTKPLFDVNPEQLSEDEDPFAELDKQYHVAVDHNFIEAEDPTLPEYMNTSTAAPSGDVDYRDNSSVCKTPIKKEFHQDLRLPEAIDNSIIHAIESNIKAELLENEAELSSYQIKTDEHNIINKQTIEEPKERDDSSKSDLSNSSLNKSSIRSNSRKRSVDQRPSHRKEKRKKTESSSVETNKQILNKNIIINLNDCAKKAENCDSSGKSIFNLYFSKGQTGAEALKEKKNEGSDSGYSEKYVKRKESPSKPVKEKVGENKKNNSSSSSHSTSTSKDNTYVTPTKSDSKLKLQTFDMFESQPRKSSSVHQLHRNSGNPVPANSTPKSASQDDKVKTLPLKSISKQVTRKHVSTQVIRKVHSRECQTVENRSTTRLAVRGVQTDPVIIERPVNNSTNAYDRMKEIDMEIQILLKEKFQLYHSMENKDANDPDVMQSFGMTVFNLQKNNDMDAHPGVMNVDSIVDDFTNIPQEELEQIALETIELKQEVATQKVEKNTRRQKIQKQEIAHPSSLSSRKRKKPVSPNIALLEQIITDERPLEEIISLDAFETSPVKTRNNRNKRFKKMPKKTVKMQPEMETVLPQCYVRLIREDFSHYLKPNLTEYAIATPEIEVTELVPVFCSSTEVVVEPTISDFHFQDDMLDVSEDIVIGSNCEVKLDVKELVADSVIEEVVLDNSQTEEQASTATADAPQGNTCKMYDYSADEDLRQDSFCITGNGDAVLAIECIENNFLAACLDGNVYHFNNDGQLLTTLRGSNLAVTCLTIVNEKYGTTVYTGSLDSRIRYYDLETGLEKGPECNVLSPIQTMDRAWDTVFVGTRTGFVLQFECKNNMLIPVSTIKFSEQAILALRALKEGPRKVLLVAARSENVTIKDAQTGLLLRTLCGPKMTVYTLLYEDGKIYCGTSSNQIQVFDYASGTHIGKHDGGKGAVCLRSAGGVLFAGCYDGCVYAFRAGETEPFAQLRGPGVMLLSLAVVGSKIIAGYKDRSLYIWKIPISIMQEMVL